MSRQEQAALMAWLNSFRPSRRVTAFDQLSDGKTLMEVGWAFSSALTVISPL
jgi:protein HOOK3